VFDTYEKILCLLLIEEEDEKAPVKINETINISIQIKNIRRYTKKTKTNE